MNGRNRMVDYNEMILALNKDELERIALYVGNAVLAARSNGKYDTESAVAFVLRSLEDFQLQNRRVPMFPPMINEQDHDNWLKWNEGGQSPK